MKKALALVVAASFLVASAFAQESGISANSLETSSADSTNNSSQDSWAESSAQTSDQSSQNSSGGDSTAFLAISSTVVVLALTAGGIVLTVRASRVKARDVIALQDQIYAADGKEYREILSFFDLDDRDIGSANDELVEAGYTLGSDQEAAEYLAQLMIRLARRSNAAKVELLGT